MFLCLKFLNQFKTDEWVKSLQLRIKKQWIKNKQNTNDNYLHRAFQLRLLWTACYKHVPSFRVLISSFARLYIEKDLTLFKACMHF